ncbi:excisionase [Qipengyuania citrea]|nr:excisionase [Qipengyuania citrea]
MRATGLGRTKINDLMNDGTLVRKKMGRRTLITVESIERLLG